MTSGYGGGTAGLGGRPDSVEVWAPDDPTRQAVLRESLTAIAEQHPDPEVRRLVQRCLAGDLSIRELVREPRFESAMDVAMTELADEVQQMDPEELAAWMARGRAIDDEGLPGERPL